MPLASATKQLRLRVGELVEVRNVDEILNTLNENGQFEGLPFMPEMLQFCGKRFHVYKSAHKACDTIGNHGCLRVDGSVHLEGLRCDGSAHDGCQAGCLIFWKEAWLKRVGGTEKAKGTSASGVSRRRDSDLHALLARATRAPAEGAEVRYSCQATRLLEATVPLRWWDIRQYVKDITSGNVNITDFARYTGIAVFNIVMRRLRLEGRHAYPAYPYVPGLAKKETCSQVLNLRPGEVVEVRTKDEIMHTIDYNRRNRGLSFDVEMEPYCGKTFRVLRRVERIIDEKTGKMININRDCLILEGVVCRGCLSRGRLFCPRSIYPYWREIWLRRVDEALPEKLGEQRSVVESAI